MPNKIDDNTAERDSGISLIRFIALVMIISCHFCQYYELEIAWWLNAGVQIFLCISGYLYGRRNVGNVMSFYGRRFKKILLPYYFVIAVFIISMFALRGGVPVTDIGKMVIMSGTVSGGGHLWFVPTILFCYVLTPLLEKGFSIPFVKDRFSFAAVTLFSMLIAALFCMGFAEGYDQTCLVCYIIGYALGLNSVKRYFKETTLTAFFALLALMNGIQIYFDYVKHLELSDSLSQLYDLWARYNHVWLGVFLFLFLKHIFSNVGRGGKFLSFADSVSYETYLVHQFFILGPFSLLKVIKDPLAAVPAALLCIVLAAVLLKYLIRAFELLFKKKAKG